MDFKKMIPFLFILAMLFYFLPFIGISEGPFSLAFSGYNLLNPKIFGGEGGFGGMSFPIIGSVILLLCLIAGTVFSFWLNNNKITKFITFICIAWMILFLLIINSLPAEDSLMSDVTILPFIGWYLILLLLIGVLVIDFLTNANTNQQQTFFNPINPSSPSNANDTMGIMQQKVQAASQNIAEQFNALKPNPSPSQFTASLIWETSNKRINKHMAEEALSLACKEFHLDYELLDEFNKKELHSGNSLYYRKVLVFSQNQMKLSSSFSNYFQEYYYRNMFKQVLKEG